MPIWFDNQEVIRGYQKLSFALWDESWIAMGSEVTGKRLSDNGTQIALQNSLEIWFIFVNLASFWKVCCENMVLSCNYDRNNYKLKYSFCRVIDIDSISQLSNFIFRSVS